jgi:hypothetical protein
VAHADPLHNDRANGSSIWVMDKLGAPLDVVDVAQGGGRGLQAVSSGVTYYGPQGALDIESLDVPLVRWGTPYPFPTPLTGYPDLREGASFILMANPWNTYVNTGLPVGPIANPGELAIKAAMEPEDGPWLYFVTVNLETGETVFTNTISEHEAAVEQWRAWCADNPDGGC